MATFTTNYNLRKPAGSDFVTVASDINASMDTIDTELKDRADRLVDLETGIIGRMSKGSAQTISNSTSTALTFGNADRNTGSICDTANNRFLVPSGQGGWYVIGIVLRWAANTVGGRSVTINVGGTSVATNNIGAESVPSGPGSATNCLVIEQALLASDAVTFDCFQNSGGNLDTATNFGGTFCWIRRVAD